MFTQGFVEDVSDIPEEVTEKSFRGAKMIASNDATRQLIANHKAEHDALVEKNMTDAGFVRTEVIKTIWTRTPSTVKAE